MSYSALNCRPKIRVQGTIELRANLDLKWKGKFWKLYKSTQKKVFTQYTSSPYKKFVTANLIHPPSINSADKTKRPINSSRIHKTHKYMLVPVPGRLTTGSSFKMIFWIRPVVLVQVSGGLALPLFAPVEDA